MDDKEAVFIFLEDLRKSGKINMFGAVPIVQEVFGLDRYDARDIVIEWMDSFTRS
jgi:hypothetical protein